MLHYRCLLSLLFVLIISYSEAGNPVMLIRCALVSLQCADCGCPNGYFESAAGDCYKRSMSEDDCPEGLVRKEVGDGIYICVPDCADITLRDGASNNCDESGSVWNIDVNGCLFDSEVQGFSELCGCPAGFETNFDDGFKTNIGESGSGFCRIPAKTCYDGDITFSIDPIVCDEDIRSASVTVTIKGVPAGQYISISELENCELITDDNFLLALKEVYSADAGFESNSEGCIVIEFQRDPTLPTVIKFVDVDSITIPACPTLDAADPCSCNPNNVTDANGIVQYWYDELTITGTPDDTIRLVQNITPLGFLKPTPSTGSETPFSNNEVLGVIRMSGVLVIPYYKKVGSDINITFDDDNNPMTAGTAFTEVCNVDPASCLVAAPIPTLSQWSVFILGLLLLIVSTVTSWHFVLRKSLETEKIRR